MNWFIPPSNDSENCFGVDPNKNFDFSWMKKGTSSDECSDYYGGPYESSEPEVKLVSNFLMNFRRNIEMFISIDGFGQKVAFSSKGINSDVVEVAQAGVRKLKSSKLNSRNKFAVESRRTRSGSIDQFAMHKANIKYSYNLELRDDEMHGFFVPATSIRENSEELFEIIRGMVANLIGI